MLNLFCTLFSHRTHVYIFWFQRQKIAKGTEGLRRSERLCGSQLATGTTSASGKNLTKLSM